MFSFYGIFGLEVEIYFVVKKNSKYSILSTFSREEIWLMLISCKRNTASVSSVDSYNYFLKKRKYT